MHKRPVALFILDGWGIREQSEGNAVKQAQTPNFNHWYTTYERAILDASGEEVGLPFGQMGNSEVGHLNLGAGRIVYQDITRIHLAIRNGTFFQNPTLTDNLQALKTRGGNLHLIGLLGDGGVHSHQDHMYALMKLAHQYGVTPILHIITDGRDTPPQSAAQFIEKLEKFIAQENIGVIASVSGRYYAMDRDNRWPRTELGYNAIIKHEAPHSFATASSAIAASHQEGVTDEFIIPVTIQTDHDVAVKPGDALIFYNFRADRMRQLVKAIALPDFDGFAHDHIPDLALLTMTNYDATLPVQVIFPEVELTNVLAQVISQAGLRQLHAAETEKYPHVTYFFNGGAETPFPGEERILANSPKVATYDLQPEMSAYELTEKVAAYIQEQKPDFVLVNFANPDMVGHTGVLSAAIKAVETVDECAGRLVDLIVAQGGVALVTADHGNCERMVELTTGLPHTYHTTNPVGLFIIGSDYVFPRPRGILADVAPTVLHLLGVPQPTEMTGLSLLYHTQP
jgi:2,3-bisphosphoglycerate-independent phosphoglycerate mutase